MRRMKPSFLILTAGIFLFSVSLFAHHGVAHYDMKKTIVLSGTVTAFDWGNPHCLVHLDVMSDAGHFEHWTLEMASIFAMSKRGWSKDSLKRGDQVVAETHPAQNGAPLGISSNPDFALKFVVNGKEISAR